MRIHYGFLACALILSALFPIHGTGDLVVEGPAILNPTHRELIMRIRNNATRSLSFKEIVPTCSCVLYEAGLDWRLDPGDSHDIRLRVVRPARLASRVGLLLVEHDETSHYIESRIR